MVRQPQAKHAADLPIRIVLVLVLLCSAAYAYLPLLAAGPLGEDFPVLSGSSRLAFSSGGGRSGSTVVEVYAAPGAGFRPLAALSLGLSARLHAEPEGRWTASAVRPLRLENLALLGIAAFGLALFVRRGLLPWTGPEQARAAGFAAAVLCIVHPLCVAAVARVASRGDLLALALGAWGLAAFLRGRQRHEERKVGIAAFLCFCAGLASPAALLLPPILAFAEYSSARRHRRRAVRLRTATTTFVVFGTCVVLEGVGRFFVVQALGAPEPSASATGGVAPPQAVALGVEKLGVLLLPVNANGMLAVVGYGLAGLFVLFALQPAFVAARSAPRLWGRILFGWSLAVFFALAPDTAVRVVPSELGGAHVLLPASLVMAVGFGVASTALSGLRRVLLPLALGPAYAVLAHANAVPWVEASGRVDALRRELTAQAVASGWDTRFLIVDPPSSVAGLDAYRPALGALLDPAFRDAENVAALRGDGWVRGLELDALLAFTRQTEFTELRREGLVVVLSPAALGLERDVEFLSTLVPPPRESEGHRFWRQEGRTPPGLVLEALETRGLVVAALPDTRTDAPPILRWNASSRLVPEGEHLGVWLADEDGPMAVFDLGRSLAWLLGGRITPAWLPEPLTSIASGEFLEDVPAIDPPLHAETDGDDWVFGLWGERLSEPLGEPAHWRLGLFDLAGLEYRELSVEIGSRGELRAAGAEREVLDLERKGRGPFVWYLDRRVGTQTVRRVEGHRF